MENFTCRMMRNMFPHCLEAADCWQCNTWVGLLPFFVAFICNISKLSIWDPLMKLPCQIYIRFSLNHFFLADSFMQSHFMFTKCLSYDWTTMHVWSWFYTLVQLHGWMCLHLQNNRVNVALWELADESSSIWKVNSFSFTTDAAQLAQYYQHFDCI